MKERFAVNPDRRPTFFFCAYRLGRRTWIQIISYLAIVAASSIAINSAIPVSWRKYRIDSYCLCLYTHAGFTLTLVAARQVFKDEKIRGRQRTASRDTLRYRWQYARQFCRTFIGHLHSGLSYAFGTAFVHVTSIINLSSKRSILVYSFLSIALKLAAQECAKHVLLRRHAKDIRMMAVVVGMPTVLIDTQVRIVVQRMQTLTFSIVGTIGMAVAELAFRLVKVALLKLQIHRREQRASITPTLANSMEHQTQPADDWKHRVQTYHVVEVYADMLAEYIAAGSALAFVGFYWNHPKYLLHRAANTENADLDLQYGTNARQLVVLATQIGVQIVVDYVSCIVTIRNGIGFGAITRYATFTSAVFITMASFNMQISALMYLDPDG